MFQILRHQTFHDDAHNYLHQTDVKTNKNQEAPACKKYG